MAKTSQFRRFLHRLNAACAVITAAVACSLAAGCGGEPGPVPQAPPYVDPGFTEAGAYRLYYALTLSRDLPSGIAGSYGIQPRRNLAVLALTLAPSDERKAPAIDAPEIEAVAVFLTGERETLSLTRRDEAERPTWIATLQVPHRVPLTIEIRARATLAGPELRARLTREFRLD
jgi:hypothetical protein